MPTSLRTRLRGSHAGSPASARGPVEYALLALAAAILVGLVFLALGNLLNEQMDCASQAQTAASASRC